MLRAMATGLCILWPLAAMACTVEEATSSVELQSMGRVGELAKQSMPVLASIKKINAKGKDPRKSLGEQLSIADAGQFSELRQRLMAIQLLTEVESGRGRDVRVIGELFSIASKLYLGGPEPKESGKDYKQYMHLISMRYLAEAPQFKSALVVVPATQSTECSIESALFSVEEESFTKINRFDVGEAKREIDAVSSRYGITGQIDRTKLSSQDRGIIDRLERTVLGPAKHERAFIDDLEDLRALARMAELKFMANTKDVTDSGGNADTVGQTLAKMKLIGREKLALLILNKIDSDFPSDNMKMMRLLQAATKGAIASPGAGRRNQ